MARYVALPKELVASPILYGKKPCASYTAFGSGQFEYFGVSGTFTVPEGVTRVRVTALGAGGAGTCGRSPSRSCNNSPTQGGHGGGGAGYVLAEVAVTPGTTCTVTVGSYPGGTTCMGTQIIANGGCNASIGCSALRCDNYSQTCGFCDNLGCGGAGGTGVVCGAEVTSIVTASGSCGTCGLCGSACDFASCFSAFRVQDTNCNVCVPFNIGGKGGAAGSYLGVTASSPFPGTLGADIFACKAFNGEALAVADLSVPVVKPRWPGEFIVSTSRLDTSIAGTAAGFPSATYIASVFGGANSSPCCCDTAIRCNGVAGCGGGGPGNAAMNMARCCNCSYSNQNVCGSCPCGQCGPALGCVNGGNGYFVIEY